MLRPDDVISTLRERGEALISIAHPIFYGLGAYTSALLARDAGLPVPLASPVTQVVRCGCRTLGP